MPSRRLFVQALASAVGYVCLPGFAAVSQWDFAAIRVEQTGLDASQWAMVAKVQDHLLPSEPDAPGAREINATQYLQWVLSDPEFDSGQRELIARGAQHLDGLLRESSDMEAALRQYEQEPGGKRWISTLLDYLLEALLADPVYGANPDQIGWKWLQHQPGFRCPGAGQRYFLLGTKAGA